MGPFQWGVLLAALFALLRFPFRADKGKGGSVTGVIVIAGFCVLVLVGFLPDQVRGFGGFFGFLIGAVVFWLPWQFAFRGMLARHKERMIGQAAERKAVQAQYEADREAARAAAQNFLEEAAEKWPTRTDGRSDGKAALLANSELNMLRFVRYETSPAFSVSTDVIVSIEDIISVDTRATYKTETVTRTELVPVSITNKKSPVGRAIVGGLIAGPAGVVVGAASGLGGKSTIQNEERKVTEEVRVPGPPMLVIGTVHPEHAVIKMQFEGNDTADQWMYKLRAAKVRSQGSVRLR